MEKRFPESESENRRDPVKQSTESNGYDKISGMTIRVNRQRIQRAKKGKDNMSYAVVTLKKGEGRTLKAGGAWIFDNEIESITGGFDQRFTLCWYTTLTATPWDGDSSTRIPRSEFE